MDYIRSGHPTWVMQSSQHLDRLFDNNNVTAHEGSEEGKARTDFKDQTSECSDVSLETRSPLKAYLLRLSVASYDIFCLRIALPVVMCWCSFRNLMQSSTASNLFWRVMVLWPARWDMRR